MYSGRLTALLLIACLAMAIPPRIIAEEKPCGCWINPKTGESYPASRIVPLGTDPIPFLADPNHAHVPAPRDAGGAGTTWVRDPERGWISPETGKPYPCSRLVPLGTDPIPFLADPNHAHVPAPRDTGGAGTTWVRVPCPSPTPPPPPSHAAVKTTGQPIVEINPPTPVPLFELGIGYNYIHAPDEDVKDLHGLNASFFYNFNSWFAFGGEFMGDWGCDSFDEFGSVVHTSLDRYVYVFGPRVSLRPTPAFTVFAQALVGGDHDSSDTTFTTNLPANARAATFRTSFSSSADCWAFDFGVGADWRFAEHWSWRIVEASYLATTFSSGNNDHWQDNWRVSTGLVYHWGGPRTTTTSTAAIYDSKDARSDAK